METTQLTDTPGPPSGPADPLGRLRAALRVAVPLIAAETGCDEAAVLALFSSRIARAMPNAASPAIAAGLALLRAELDAQVSARLGRPGWPAASRAGDERNPASGSGDVDGHGPAGHAGATTRAG